MATLERGAMVGGRYRLETLLGEGGMGSVWSATHTITGGRVALKFVKGADTSPDMRRRIHREARAANLVEHPNVVTIRDVFDHEDTPVLVMDLLNGETLADRVARVGRLELGDASRIALAVIAAVGAAHEIGMIHRDLKPENVFLVRSSSGESVRVLDFGIAKIVRHDSDEFAASAVTQSGALVGTPAYMAPEQLFGERDLDHRVDVWALGVMLFEMLVGQRPIDGENFGQLAKRLLTKPMPSLAEHRPDLPEDVVALVDEMLQRERDDRLVDLREAADVLAKHASQPRPSFGAPKPVRLEPDSGDNDARVVVSVADPSAPTQMGPSARRTDPQAETLVSEPSPSRPRARQDTAVPHVTATRATQRSRTPYVVLAACLVAGAVVSLRALAPSPTPPVPSTPATKPLAPHPRPKATPPPQPPAEPTTSTVVTEPSAAPSSTAPPLASTVSVTKPSKPAVTTTASAKVPPSATSLATAPSVPPPPPPPPAATPSAGTGLVTKPPF